MNKKLVYLEKVFFLSFVFLIPTQMALHFWPQYAFVFGVRIDFLSPAIYLTDILLFLVFVTRAINKKRIIGREILKHKKTLLPLFLFALINIVFSSQFAVSAYRWLRIFEVVCLFFYAKNRSKIFLDNIFVKILSLSAAMFSLIGVLQFFLGRTLGGPLYLLGERTFNISTPGISLVSFFGQDHMRAYSTFSHPNSLAGFLGVVLIFLFFYSKRRRFSFEMALMFICFILTFSLSSYISLLGVIVVYLLRRLKFLNRLVFYLGTLTSLILPLISRKIYLASLSLGNSVSERINLASISGSMISSKFLFGVGLGTFVLNIPRYSWQNLYSWLLQPVHNLLLLSFSETGIFGLMVVLVFFYRHQIKTNSNIKYVMLFVFLSGLFDHYWLTLQQNFLIMALLLGIVGKEK